MEGAVRYVVSVRGCVSCGDHDYRSKTEKGAEELVQTLTDLRDSTCTAKYEITTEPDPEAE
jgi:hypothetical protein